MGIRSTIFKEEMSRYIVNMTAGVFGRSVLIGAGAGFLTWILGWVANRYVVMPFFCEAQENVSICMNSTVISSNIAAVFVGIMVVPLFAMVATKRALLVVIGAVAALWGVAAWVAGDWWMSLLWTVAAYAGVYAALAWINRLRGTLAAIVCVVAFVVLARLILSL